MKSSDTQQPSAREPHVGDEMQGAQRWWQRSVFKKDGAVITILLLALGATLGATLRYYATIWAAARFGTAFPYGTLLVNLVGSFVLGGFLTLATGRFAVSPEMRLLIATGFCGSLTTFSTFSYETLALVNAGNYLTGLLNAFGSLALGLIGVAVGATLARALFP